MSLGILFMTVTGFLWVLMGWVISFATQKRLNLGFIQGFAGLLVTLLVLPAIFTGEVPQWAVTLCVLLSGFGNYYTFIVMNRAMERGPHGLVWAMIQSAFFIPFVMGIVFFGVPCSIFRLIGLIVLIAATGLMGVAGQKSNQEKNGEKSSSWLVYTIVGLLMAGAVQICANLPSYLVKAEAFKFTGLLFRCGLMGAGFALGWIVHSLYRKEIWNGKHCSLPVTMMVISLIGACICLFYGLDMLAKAGVGAIGYPLGMGVSIAAFQVYTAISLKERISFLSFLSILLCLIGIGLLTR